MFLRTEFHSDIDGERPAQDEVDFRLPSAVL
jgi:hypothetical protein